MNNKRTFAIIVFALVCVGTTCAQSEAITVSETPSQEKQNIVSVSYTHLNGAKHRRRLFHLRCDEAKNPLRPI